MAREQLANIDRGALTLAADINNSATSLTLGGSYSNLPTANFRLRLDNEFVTVGSRSGASCSSVTRGVEGSTAASHTTSATVSAPITAAGFLAAGATANRLAVKSSTTTILTTSFADVTDLALALPEAGTYLIAANVRAAMTDVTGGAFISVQLTDNSNTMLADIAGTDCLAIPVIGYNPTGATDIDVQLTTTALWIVTVASAQTIKLRAKYTLSSGAVTNPAINSDTNGYSTMAAVRLN